MSQFLMFANEVTLTRQKNFGPIQIAKINLYICINIDIIKEEEALAAISEYIENLSEDDFNRFIGRIVAGETFGPTEGVFLNITSGYWIHQMKRFVKNGIITQEQLNEAVDANIHHREYPTYDELRMLEEWDKKFIPY